MANVYKDDQGNVISQRDWTKLQQTEHGLSLLEASKLAKARSGSDAANAILAKGAARLTAKSTATSASSAGAPATGPAMPKIPTSGNTADLLKYYQDLETYQSVQNKTRETEIRGLYGGIIDRYSSGGSFEAEALGQLNKQKTQDVGKYTQDMIGSGMYGTTQTAQLGSRWEQEIGAPSRLKLEDIMAQRLSGAQGDMASFIERIQNTYPDTGQIASLFKDSSSGATGYQGGSVGGGGGSSGSDQSRYLWPDTPAQDLSGGAGLDLKGIPNQGAAAAWKPYETPTTGAVAKYQGPVEGVGPMYGDTTGGSSSGGGLTMGYRDTRSGTWKAGSPPSDAPMYQMEPKITSTINAGPRASKPLDLSSMDASVYYGGTPTKPPTPTVKNTSIMGQPTATNKGNVYYR